MYLLEVKDNTKFILGDEVEDMFTVYEGIREEKIYTWEISIDDINADDFYVYEEDKNLTSEEAYEQIINGKKVYNDEIFGEGVYLSLYDYSPALFHKDGSVIVNKDGKTKWLPETDEEFENRYYVI
ncbi:hypothetical protein CLBKI_51490 [Clostridium beijerinckii]|uniref:hypothetical protein n=1 Tax=Clostridium beijerinckii TaxID=1520 RepID=UPI0009C63B67|nr:hypothetical protein [Clostridium beijerinckii]OOM45560.1 hypothetical protein CLBKI_51490 [Clostridium beijerinckii]